MRRSPYETWMFSVIFWILCSWLPCLADWQVSCSRCVVQLQQNICHQNDCEHEWQSTFSLKMIWESKQNFCRRDEYRQPDKHNIKGLSIRTLRENLTVYIYVYRRSESPEFPVNFKNEIPWFSPDLLRLCRKILPDCLDYGSGNFSRLHRHYDL